MEVFYFITEPTEKENIENMKRCPRYEAAIGCSIPRCPLDYWMWERVESQEDKICPLRRLLGKTKSKRTNDKLSATLKDLLKFIPKRNYENKKGR